jgi:hypothetical protein
MPIVRKEKLLVGLTVRMYIVRLGFLSLPISDFCRVHFLSASLEADQNYRDVIASDTVEYCNLRHTDNVGHKTLRSMPSPG